MVLKDKKWQRAKEDEEARKYNPAREEPEKFYTDRNNDGRFDAKDEEIEDDEIDFMLLGSDPRWW